MGGAQKHVHQGLLFFLLLLTLDIKGKMSGSMI